MILIESVLTFYFTTISTYIEHQDAANRIQWNLKHSRMTEATKS
jgi:hypothetical protein